MPQPNYGYLDPYSSEAAEIERKRRYADALREQSGTPIQPYSVGGMTAPISWTQGAAKLLQGYNAGAAGREADQRAKDLRGKVQADALRWYGEQPQAGVPRALPTDQEGTGAMDMAGVNTPQTSGAPSKNEMMAWLLRGQGNPMSAPMATAMMAAQIPKRPEPFTLAPGAVRYDESGKPVASAPNKPPVQGPSDLDRLLRERDALPPGDPRRQIYDNAIRKQSETAHQIVNNVQPPPITAVTIQDPNDPNGTIVIDGRTKQVLGKGPKLTDTGKLENKRQFNMQGIGATIKGAEDILTGAGGADLPTGSGVGTAVDMAAGLVGYSPPGANEAAKLKSLGGALVAKMPRMEGPQSDRDVILYKEMAGKIGDSTVPRAQRIAALETVKDLWSKYERLNPDAFATPSRRATDAVPDQPPPGAVRARR